MIAFDRVFLAESCDKFVLILCLGMFNSDWLESDFSCT